MASESRTPRMDQLLAMRAFVGVAVLGSSTHAADDLGLARSAVSHLVQRLEIKLGGRLLNRTSAE